MATSAYVAPSAEPLDEGLSLRDYLGVIWRRKWVIILTVIVSTGAAYFFSARQIPQYQASSDLLYQSNSDVAALLGNYGYGNTYQVDSEMRAIASILQGPEMVTKAEAIIKEKYDGAFTSNARVAQGLQTTKESSSSSTPGYSVTATVPDTSGTNSIGSNIVTVSAQSTSPELAAAAANAYAKAYVDWRKAQQKGMYQKAIDSVLAQMQGITLGAQSPDYLILQQRLHDLKIFKDTASGNYTQLVFASVPAAPFAPQPMRSAALGLGVGLFAGIGLAFLLEQLDTRLHRQEEIASILRQPILGRIPRMSRKLLGKDALVALHRPESHVAEAFRVIRTNLEFMSVDQKVASILVTSCQQGEGKSVSVANLAVVMAMTGKKIVVVDGDLRRPRVHEYFHVDNDVGVSTVATNQTPLAEALQPVEIAPQNGDGADGDYAAWAASPDAKSKLFVLPSGPLPPNPGEIVASRRFELMIQALEKEADLVIVDSPAMLAVGDTAALAPKVDGLVFLVDLKAVKRPMLQQAAEQLAKLPVAQLGVMVRMERASGSRYGYYGYYGYGRPYASQAEPGRNGSRKKARVKSGA